MSIFSRSSESLSSSMLKSNSLSFAPFDKLRKCNFCGQVGSNSDASNSSILNLQNSERSVSPLWFEQPKRAIKKLNFDNPVFSLDNVASISVWSKITDVAFWPCKAAECCSISPRMSYQSRWFKSSMRCLSCCP